MVFPQYFLINSRLIIKAFGIAHGNKLYKVFIAFHVFRKKHQMIIAYGFPSVFIKAAFRRNINLTADNRLNALLLAGLVKLHNSEHCSVVGYGKAVHAQLLCTLNKLWYFRRTVKKAVFRMNMKMRKIYFIFCFFCCNLGVDFRHNFTS